MHKIALLTQEGSDGPLVFFVSESATMGSSAACEVAVKSAAPQHCRVVRSNEGYLVRDLTGQGLIKLNGKSTFGALLQEGDLLEIGRDSFRFSEGFETEAEESPEVQDRPPKKGTQPIPRPAPRSGKTRVAVPAVRDSLAQPQPPRRRIPLVPLAVAVGLALGVLALSLFLPKSRTESAKSPGVASRGSSLPETPRPRRSKDSDVAGRTPVSSPADFPVPPTSESEAASRVPAEPSRPPAAGAAGSDLPSFVVPRFAGSAPAASISSAGLDQFLKDPARRSLTGERLSMARMLRAGSLDSEVHRAAAIAMGWTTNAWELNATQALVWEAYAKGTSFDALELLTAADHMARARMLLESGKAPVLRLFALAHLVEALSGDPSVSGLLNSSGYRLSADGKRWGDVDGVFQHKVTQYYHDHARDDPSLETKALASPDFGTRYAGLLLALERSLRRGSGIQSTWRDLSTSSAPETLAGASAHLRALAESYRKGVLCKECKNGRVPCPQCQGKGRIDAPCPACNGEGRIMAPGAVNGAQVSQRCNACDGRKVFKQVGCPACSRTGTVGCSSCGGDPWHERSCTNPNCRDGWVRCQTCRGGGRVDVPCPDCGGTGRVTAPGSAVGAQVTQKCRTCNEDHGVFKRLAKCQTCGGNGLAKCGTCEGKAPNQKPAIAPVSEVFSTEPCTECKGSGWPSPRMAIPCFRCLGLGVRIKPAADPSKTLD